MRLPSFSRREEPAPTAGGNHADHNAAVATDTRPDAPPRSGARNEGPARAATPVKTRNRERTRDRARGTDLESSTDRDRSTDLERTVDLERSADRGAPVAVDGDTSVDRTPAADVPPAPAGPRPRASLLATLGLVAAVAGILFVLTGLLAGYGIALGAAGAVLAVLGLIATRRRHVVGKPDALLGMAVGLGAVVLGVLAMTGQYDWPSTAGDAVARFREWLDAQFVDRW